MSSGDVQVGRMTARRPADARPSASALIGWIAVALAVATLAVVVLPFFRFAYRAPALHTVIETANALIALLVGYLLYGRFAQHRRLQDLLLGLALGTVAVANLVLTAVPSALLTRGEQLTEWAPLAVRLLGTVALAAAAMTPVGKKVSRRGAGAVTAVVVTALLVLAAAGLLWGSRLPPAVDPQLLGDPSQPQLLAHPAVLVVQGVSGALYALAAVAFARRADVTGDELVRWVAAGCVLAAYSRVHYLLYPSLYTDFVYTGDLLRLGFYALLLVGGGREITSFWEARSRTAVLEDRRRVARDLHDGLVQELSYIWAQSRRLASRPGDTVTVERIGSAAGRAIEESRRAVAALATSEDEPLPTLIRRLGDDLASRYDVVVLTTADPAVEVDGPMAEALLRITGEAVRNAVRHGSAMRIDVVLTAEPLSLTVVDDGRGFDPGSPVTGRPGGFGLTSMRERAEEVGGTLTVESMPGKGTVVRVSWT